MPPASERSIPRCVTESSRLTSSSKASSRRTSAPARPTTSTSSSASPRRPSSSRAAGGKWIYVVNKEGTKAAKREIRIGRQNPQYYEVLEGLEPGEKVITSGYDTYGDSDVLVF